MNKPEYWEFYYSKDVDRVLSAPSQFAVFVESELPDVKNIIDVGCGNGRDSLFFAARERSVIGLDASSSSIEYCRRSCKISNLTSARFEQYDVSLNLSLSNQLLDINVNSIVLIYARFFLHAIDETSEDKFIESFTRICDRSIKLAFEFRTTRDEGLRKVTSNHYRRYINPMILLEKLYHKGFSIDYYVEGFGFAKYKEDDAYVARVICKRII